MVYTNTRTGINYLLLLIYLLFKYKKVILLYAINYYNIKNIIQRNLKNEFKSRKKGLFENKFY